MDISNKILINQKEYDMNAYSTEKTKELYIKSFGDEHIPEIKIIWSHIQGFRLDLFSDIDEKFDVKIYDKNSLIYETQLSNNMFCKLSRQYFNGIRYEIYYKNNLIKDETISFSKKRVFISFESSSLGDTISWLPYCEQFRVENDCEVIVSTFKNFLFEKSYPELKFVGRGEIVENINVMFNVGWFYDKNKEPHNPATIPLQKSITNILGLEFKEIRSKVDFIPKERPYNEKYITIATSSTAGCKLWNYPNGWEKLADYLNKIGYKVINISKEGDIINGVQNIIDNSLDNTMNVIYHSEFLIGLSSGLSWLSWALNKHVVMISNFTESDHEFTINCTRITNPDVCNGCWNNPMFKFDKGDWYWCPEHKNTNRQFECHKSITTEMVINEIKELL